MRLRDKGADAMSRSHRTAKDVAELARHYYVTVDTSDALAVSALFDAEAVYRRPGYDPISGRTELLDFYSQDRVIERGRHEVTGLVVNGESVAVQGTFAGRLRDGSNVELGFADFFRFSNGLIVERNTYFAVPAV